LWSILEAGQNSEWKYTADGQLWRFGLWISVSFFKLPSPFDNRV
jgi:hypothetical protein